MMLSFTSTVSGLPDVPDWSKPHEHALHHHTLHVLTANNL